MSNLSVISLKKAMTEAGFILSEGEGFLVHEFQMARDYLANIGLAHIGDAFHTFEEELSKGSHALANGVKGLVARFEPKFDPETGKPIVVASLNNSPLLVTDPTPGHTANTTTIIDLHAAAAEHPIAIVAAQPAPSVVSEEDASQQIVDVGAAQAAEVDAKAVQASAAAQAEAAAKAVDVEPETPVDAPADAEEVVAAPAAAPAPDTETKE